MAGTRVVSTPSPQGSAFRYGKSVRTARGYMRPDQRELGNTVLHVYSAIGGGQDTQRRKSAIAERSALGRAAVEQCRHAATASGRVPKARRRVLAVDNPVAYAEGATASNMDTATGTEIGESGIRGYFPATHVEPAATVHADTAASIVPRNGAIAIAISRNLGPFVHNQNAATVHPYQGTAVIREPLQRNVVVQH